MLFHVFSPYLLFYIFYERFVIHDMLLKM